MQTKLCSGLLLLTVLATPGCYLSHVTAGQARLLSAREPIEKLLDDPDTPAELRAQLRLVQEARSYARDLGLEVGGQYTSYVAWPGDRVVTIVVTARAGEVEPARERWKRCQQVKPDQQLSAIGSVRDGAPEEDQQQRR